MKLKMSNFAQTTLAGGVDEVATTILLSPGTGSQFPSIVAGQYFPLVLLKLVDGSPAREIVHVTARNVDSCTVLRAREGSTALTFSSGDIASHNHTAAGINGKADLEGADFTGPITMGDQPFKQAVLQDCGSKVATVPAPTGTTHTIDYREGSYQVWNPPSGPCTLVITNWPPAGVNGELWIEGVNLGLSTITTQVALDYLKPDGSYTTTTSVNANQGATLRTSGIDNLLIWGREGAPKRAKIAR